MFLMGVVKESMFPDVAFKQDSLSPTVMASRAVLLDNQWLRPGKVGFWPRYWVWLMGGPLNTPQQNPLSGPTTLNQD